MKFYLQGINSLEGLGMFFSSAVLVRRLRRYAATVSILVAPLKMRFLLVFLSKPVPYITQVF